jgi:maltodextrin utilization protein YvdJ
MSIFIKTDRPNFSPLKQPDPMIAMPLNTEPSNTRDLMTLRVSYFLNETTTTSQDSGLNSLSSGSSERESLLEFTNSVNIGDSLLTIEKIANECNLAAKNQNELVSSVETIESAANISFDINIRRKILCFLVIYISVIFVLLFIYLAGYFGSSNF